MRMSPCSHTRGVYILPQSGYRSLWFITFSRRWRKTSRQQLIPRARARRLSELMQSLSSMQARLSAHVLPVNHLAAKQSSWEYHTMCAWFAGQNKSALIQLQHSMHWVCTDRALYIMKLWVDQSKPSCGNFWNTYSYKGKECIFYEIQCHLSNYHQSVQKSTDPGTDPL